MPERMSIHLDRGYDSEVTRKRVGERRLETVISEKGKPAPPLQATKRWVVERTNSWHNAHKKLVWCTERRGRSSTSESPSRRWSSSYAGSSEGAGPTTVGRAGLAANRSLLAEALRRCLCALENVEILD